MKIAWRSLAAGAASIVLLTVAVYIPALRGGFLFDDDMLITNNPIVKADDGLHRFWFTTETADYYPLTESLWWLEWRLWGANTAGYHLVNVLLHAVNAILVWLILRRLRIPGAWLAALLFAVHPVNVATVAWVSEQKNTLSMLFYAVAILLYLRFDEEGRWRWYGLSLTAFLLALFSKTAVVMLPFVLLGCMWWRHTKVRRKDFLYSVPFFVLSLVLGLVTIWFQHYRALDGRTVRTGGLLYQLAVAGWAFWFYLYKVLWPSNLNMIYPKWNINPSLFASYLPVLALAGCLVFLGRNRKSWARASLFGVGYFVVMLFPVLGFFDQGFYALSLVADHWQYYSIVGIIALAVAAGVTLCGQTGLRRRSVGTVTGAVVLAALGTLTWARAGLYENAETLWRDTLAKNPNAWSAHYDMGVILGKTGRLTEEIGHLEQALQIKPDYAYAEYNLGLALGQVGREQDAIGHYEQALRIKPRMANAHNNLGTALVRVGRVQDAIGHYEQALRIQPEYAEAHYNLGVALGQAGRLEDARRHYEQALRIDPAMAEAHYNLGLALVQLGQVPEAIKHWEQAVRIKPDYAEAYFDLGVASEQTGNVRDAIRHWEQALRIRPEFAEAQNKLAWLLATLPPTEGGDAARALTLAQKACELTGNKVAACLDTLAVAYAAAGRFNEAITSGQKALELARASGQSQLAAEIESRLEIYRNGHAYHFGPSTGQGSHNP